LKSERHYTTLQNGGLVNEVIQGVAALQYLVNVVCHHTLDLVNFGLQTAEVVVGRVVVFLSLLK
jgi:hypothetical protein